MNKAENFQSSEVPSYRGLKAVVIILGVLILMAFGVLVGGLVMRAGNNGAAREAYVTRIAAEPGARVAGAEIAGNRLILRREGASSNEIVLIDAASGRVVGRVVLQATANGP
jgi:hypothetical protein